MRFSKTVNPAFFASIFDIGLVIVGEFTRLITFFTGFLQSGHCSKGARSTGLLSSKPFEHTRQLSPSTPGDSDRYSYKGIN
ncbi:hypothetical protein [Rubritalea tangerina]|uniref:hypothetical protein n=1 Tax=Rubritalea tangerina TaxID=430798 RepID=UPI0036118B82